MALAKLGAIVTALSGKVGGQSFVAGSQGTYLKNNKSNNSSASTSQKKIRSSTYEIMRLYSTLSASERKVYSDKAPQFQYENRVGETKTYNAFQLFMYLNQGRVMINESIPVVPGDIEIITKPDYDITDTTANTVKITATAVSSIYRYILKASMPLNAGISNADKYLRNIAVLTSAQLSGGYIFKNDWSEKFGPINDGMNIAYSIETVLEKTGQRIKQFDVEFFTTT